MEMNMSLLTNPYGHYSHSILLLMTNCFMLNQQDCLLAALQAHPVYKLFQRFNSDICVLPAVSLNGGIGQDSGRAGGQLGQTRGVKAAHAPVLVLPPPCRLQTVPGLGCLGDVVSPSLFLGQQHGGSGCFSASWGLSEVCFPPLTQTELKS